MEFFKALLNPGWVSSLIGLGGLIAAIILYRASRIGARPTYQSRGIKLIGKEAELPQDVDILFQGTPVPRLTMTHVVFWNSGKVLCRGNDVVTEDPIRCEFGADAVVLRVRVLKSTRPAIKFQARTTQSALNQVQFLFDYLDPGDGAMVEILHTGEKRHPTLSGTIRGVPRGMLNMGQLRASSVLDAPFAFARRGAFARSAAYGVMTAGLGIVAFGLLAPDGLLRKMFEGPHKPVNISLMRLYILIGGTIYLLPSALSFLRSRRRFPKALLVDEIED